MNDLFLKAILYYKKAITTTTTNETEKTIYKDLLKQ